MVFRTELAQRFQTRVLCRSANPSHETTPGKAEQRRGAARAGADIAQLSVLSDRNTVTESSQMFIIVWTAFSSSAAGGLFFLAAQTGELAFLKCLVQTTACPGPLRVKTSLNGD